MHSFAYKNGTLYCENVNLQELADKESTPLYVYSKQTILNHFHRLREALAPLNAEVAYAVKACSNIAILNLMARNGAGFDIVSGGELFRVLKAGGDPSKCTYAGVGKTEQEIRYALARAFIASMWNPKRNCGPLTPLPPPWESRLRWPCASIPM